MSPQETQSTEQFISDEITRQPFSNGGAVIQTDTILYDSQAEQRFAFDAFDGGEKFPTAHKFKPLSDERYLQYKKSLNLRGNNQEEDSNKIEATDALWNDLIIEVENIEPEEDWKSLIDYQEKAFALDKYTAVSIFEEEKVSTGKRKLSRQTTVVTESFFNDEPCKQTHILTPKTLDLERKWDKIKSKELQQDQIKGISKMKPTIRYVPQDDKFAALYDEMFVSQTGFTGGIMPMRFKLRVIQYVFAAKVDEKK